MIRIFFAWALFFVTVIVLLIFTQRITWIKKYILQGECPF